MRVLVFGDSIAYGAWDSRGGWVDRLKQQAHQQTLASEGAHKLQVINLGIGSDTSTKILKRMPTEIEARYSASWPFIFIFAFGTNDERALDDKVETPIQEFQANIHGIIDRAREYTDKILFVGAPPIGAPRSVFKGQEYSDERIKSYDAAQQAIVEAAGIPYIAIRPVFENTPKENLFSYDHLHPGDAGHQLIAETVWPALKELLEA